MLEVIKNYNEKVLCTTKLGKHYALLMHIVIHSPIYIE